MAMQSRKAVMEHEIYDLIFKQYGDAIGITEEPDYDALGWTEIKAKHEEIEAKKQKEAEERRIAQELKLAQEKKMAEERADREQREKELADKAAKEKIQKDFFLQLKQLNLTNHYGRKNKLNNLHRQAC